MQKDYFTNAFPIAFLLSGRDAVAIANGGGEEGDRGGEGGEEGGGDDEVEVGLEFILISYFSIGVSNHIH